MAQGYTPAVLNPRPRMMPPGLRGVTAVGYLRRSTDRQEQSIPDQKRAIEAYAEEQGLRLLRCYTDDAISGTSTVGRRGFQALMADAKRKGCDFRVVVVYDVKRFGRVGNDEAGFYRHTLKTHGIEVRYVSENFTGDRTDDLLRPVKQWQAREESKDLSKVTIRGLLTKSASGVWMGGVPPHGYDLRYETTSGGFLMHVRYLPDGAKQVFDEQWKLRRTLPRGESLAVARSDRCRLVLGEASRREAIQKIFDMYVQENRGFKAVADALNRAGVPSPRSRGWSSQYSGKWSLTTVRAILVNPAYMGDMVWNRRTDARFHKIVEGQASEREDVYAGRLEPNDPSNWIVVEDAHPSIVTRRLWGLAKAKREGSEASKLQRGINQRLGKASGTLEPGGPTGGWTGPRAKYLLSGLMICAKCGNRYEGYSQYRKKLDEHGKRIKTLNYACGGYIRHGRSVCAIGRISKDPMETVVIEAVLDYFAGYTGKNAKMKIARALSSQVGEELSQISSLETQLRKRIRDIDRSICAMLDNLTKTNRDLVDTRIAELTKEREPLEAKMDSLKHLVMGEEERRDMIAQSAKFIAGLKQALVDAPLDERQATIRRCIEEVTIDYEQQRACIAIRKLPSVTGSTAASEVETIDVSLSVPPSRGGDVR